MSRSAQKTGAPVTARTASPQSTQSLHGVRMLSSRLYGLVFPRLPVAPSMDAKHQIDHVYRAGIAEYTILTIHAESFLWAGKLPAIGEGHIQGDHHWQCLDATHSRRFWRDRCPRCPEYSRRPGNYVYLLPNKVCFWKTVEMARSGSRLAAAPAWGVGNAQVLLHTYTANLADQLM